MPVLTLRSKITNTNTPPPPSSLLRQEPSQQLILNSDEFSTPKSALEILREEYNSYCEKDSEASTYGWSAALITIVTVCVLLLTLIIRAFLSRMITHNTRNNHRNMQIENYQQFPTI